MVQTTFWEAGGASGSTARLPGAPRVPIPYPDPRRHPNPHPERGPLDDLESFVFLVCIAAAVVGAWKHHLGRLHPLHFRQNPGPGIVRAGVLVAMFWIWWVLAFRADPSVTGIYVLFYFVMGYAVVKILGQSVIGLLGARTRVDVAERQNVPAAILIAAFTVATGLIFGGSLWGEADPTGDDEGGFWIPLSFFLLGWGVLLAAFGLYLRGEGGKLAHRIQRERKLEDARAAAFFLLAAGVALTDAVSGDFWGWAHGLSTFGVLAGLVLVHEVFAAGTRREAPVSRTAAPAPRRVLESVLYAALGAAALALNRLLDALMTTG